MIVLDENIPEDQRLLLRSWRIRAYQVGHPAAKRKALPVSVLDRHVVGAAARAVYSAIDRTRA